MLSPPRLRIVICLMLALVTGAIYAPVASHEFVGFDDRVFLVDNPHLADGLSAPGLRWAATSTRDGNWMPLTWVSFLVDAEISGLAPGATHLTNVALHIATTLLLFLALAQMTRGLWPSAVVAAVFALHPLHVESVAWAIERKDVLSGFFFGLTLLLYGRYAVAPGKWGYAAVCLAFSAGLLSKPMLVTLPFVLLLLDFWPLDRLATRPQVIRALTEKLPLLAVAAMHSAVTLWAQSGRGATEGLAEVGLVDRLGNAVWSLMAYVGMAVWPTNLAVFYPHPRDSLSLAATIGALVFLTAISLTALALARRVPALLIGWLWYAGMLVPVLGVIQVGAQGLADRYMYLPLVGLTVAVAFPVARACHASAPLSRVAGVVALVVLVAFAVTTRAQLAHWKNGLSLFEHTVAVTPENAFALNALAVELMGHDRASEALVALERAVALDPRLSDAQVNLGAALLREGRPAEALPRLQRGLGQTDGLREGFVQASLGEAKRQLGDVAGALPHLQRAVDLEPTVQAYRANLGVALLTAGRTADGRRELVEAERLGEERFEIHLAIARTLQQEGHDGDAVARYRSALRLAPNAVEAANNLAWLLATSAEVGVRSPAEAVQWAEKAAAGAGDQAAVLDTLFAAYAAAGRTGEAAATGQRALEAARSEGNAELARDIQARLASLGDAP